MPAFDATRATASLSCSLRPSRGAGATCSQHLNEPYEAESEGDTAGVAELHPCGPLQASLFTRASRIKVAPPARASKKVLLIPPTQPLSRFHTPSPPQST